MGAQLPAPTSKVVWWLLGLVAAGFLGWSIQIGRAISSVEVLADKMLDIEQEIDRHRERPWHNEAGHLIRLQEKQLDRLEEYLVELRRDRLNDVE